MSGKARTLVIRLGLIGNDIESVDAAALEYRMGEIGVGEALIEADLDVVWSQGAWEPA